MDRCQNESPWPPSKHVSLLCVSYKNSVWEKHINATFMNSDSNSHALTTKLATALYFCFSCTTLQFIFVFLLDLSTFSHIHLFHFALFVFIWANLSALRKRVCVEWSCVSVCSDYSLQRLCVEVVRAFCVWLFVCVCACCRRVAGRWAGCCCINSGLQSRAVSLAFPSLAGGR